MKKIIGLFSIVLVSFSTFIVASCSSDTDGEDTSSELAKAVAPGYVRGKVLSNNGDMMVAGIIITDQNNNRYRDCTNAYGGYCLELQPGTYNLTFTKGIEFSTYSTDITVESLKTYYLRDTKLDQYSDMYSKGWICGDLHQHTIYSDGADTIESALNQNAASSMYWGFLTDHNTSRGCPEWREANTNVYTDEYGNKRTFHGFAGDEVTSEFGHFNSLGTGMTFDKYEICFRDSERGTNINANAREKMLYIGDQIRRQGGVAQINHPYSLTNMGALNYLEEDDFELFSHFDTVEIWNSYFTVPDGRFTVKNTDNQNHSAKLLWYSMLNHIKDGGKFLAATSGTDNHDATGPATAETRAKFVKPCETANQYQNLCRYERKYAGCITTYAYLGDGEINQENVLSAVTSGHTFLTNGPILHSTINGKIFGETAIAENNTVTISNDIFCRDGMSEIRVIKNGETVSSVSLNMDTTYTQDIVVENVQSQDWVLIEVLGDWGTYAISNPVFIA